MSLRSSRLQVRRLFDRVCTPTQIIATSISDWDDSQTDLAHLGGAAPGAAKSGGDKLWEDNWDDDDIEDEFSVQLRCVFFVLSRVHSRPILYTRNELAKAGKAKDADAMQQ